VGDRSGHRQAAVWYWVSTGHQDSDNQIPDVEKFAAHHGYEVVATYRTADSAYKGGGGREYKAALKQAMDDVHKGELSVLVVWALDRIVRDEENGAETALRIIRQFRERGCTVVSVQECVHVELLSAHVIVTAPSEITLYVRAFERLARLAVYGDAAWALMGDAIAALG
jgi:DNA invertase Pin-like site-specific DNA recombinase